MAAASLSKGWPSLILFGDLFRAGIWHQDTGYSFGAALTQEFSRRLQVLERGFSGYNTANARVIVDDVIPKANGVLDLKLLVIFFGANDAVLPGYGQHVDIKDYIENLKLLVQHQNLKDHGAKVVIVTPPPICEHKILPWTDRKNSVAKQYAEAAISVAEEAGVEVLKLWHVFMDYAGWKEGDPLLGGIDVPQSPELGELLSDGLHLTPKGYEKYFEAFMKLLKEKLPDTYNAEKPFALWGEAPRCDGLTNNPS
ncbi:hypothetical protein H072_7995 [Dactylellina haptotyla CBS 200.50]|uniref:SGNH hydrolase-type esterase domain-containing protein n=1 Tax=Dactylellina haptotyla (strain CBS 200.50) TaxID=1284197 RepID=S8A6C8_DACHA|nr:hypothetical protein H072_7995 [Dactylellina haptotyla CBS 200.50]